MKGWKLGKDVAVDPFKNIVHHQYYCRSDIQIRENSRPMFELKFEMKEQEDHQKHKRNNCWVHRNRPFNISFEQLDNGALHTTARAINACHCL